MSFDNVLFPVDIAFGARGGPGFDTVVIANRSGAEQRVSRRELSRRTWNVSHALKDHLDAAALRSFFIARRGATNSFRFLDHNEFSTHPGHIFGCTSSDEYLGTPDGSTTQFQLKKTFTSGNVVRTENITLPVEGTVKVSLDGVEVSGWSVDDTTGLVTFGTAPTGTELRAGCEYHKHARFSEDIDELMEFVYVDHDHVDIPNIKIVEVIDESTVPTEFYYGGGRVVEMSENVSLSTSERAWALNPSISGLQAQLPVPTELPLGGPYFSIKNLSATESVDLKYDGDTIATLGAGATTTIWLFPGPVWEAL